MSSNVWQCSPRLAAGKNCTISNGSKQIAFIAAIELELHRDVWEYSSGV